MGRIAWIAVALVLLTAAPAAQAGVVSKTIETIAKDAAKAEATGVKIENKLPGVAVTGASVEANGVKVENKMGVGGLGGGGSGGGGSGGGDDPKFRGKRA